MHVHIKINLFKNHVHLYLCITHVIAWRCNWNKQQTSAAALSTNLTCYAAWNKQKKNKNTMKLVLRVNETETLFHAIVSNDFCIAGLRMFQCCIKIISKVFRFHIQLKSEKNFNFHTFQAMLRRYFPGMSLYKLFSSWSLTLMHINFLFIYFQK